MPGSGLDTSDILYGQVLERADEENIRPVIDDSRMAAFSDQELVGSLFTDRDGAFENMVGYSGNEHWCVRSLLPRRWVPADWAQRIQADNGTIVTLASGDLDTLPLRPAHVRTDLEELRPYQLTDTALWTAHTCMIVAIEELSPEEGSWMIPTGLGRERLLYIGPAGELLGAIRVIPNRNYA